MVFTRIIIQFDQTLLPSYKKQLQESNRLTVKVRATRYKNDIIIVDSRNGSSQLTCTGASLLYEDKSGMTHVLKTAKEVYRKRQGGIKPIFSITITIRLSNTDRRRFLAL